jgi:hypothetical protein
MLPVTTGTTDAETRPSRGGNEHLSRIILASRAERLTGAPYGNRTHVSAVKGRRPRPLDEGRGPRAYGAVERARHIKRFGGSGKQHG